MGDFLSTGGGVPADLRASYAAHAQDHVFKYVDSGAIKPGSREMSAFITQLRTIDPARMNELHLSTTAAAATASSDSGGEMEPIGSFGSVSSASDEESARWFKSGLAAVKDGKVAVVVLCGGQGTRLGFDGPKGMYDIGLPSGKTLFQLQAERLLRVCALAAAEADGSGSDAASPRIPWYIMTSPLNDAATREFFESKDYFGIPKEDIFFFSQGTLPCMTREGKIILETGSKVAMAPDGNGGIYPALERKGALADMRRRGIEHVHVFSIDNALVRVADPHFLGYCIEKKADCGNKSVWKAEPGEKVGVVVKRGGKPCVVEYSEMSQEACERRETPSSSASGGGGRLVFGAGNICNHYFSRAFLEDTVLPGMVDMYHVAHKKIPAADGPEGETKKPSENNGIKLESFIFDVFPLSKNMVLFEGAREDEFAPVKNAPGSSTDSPDTAREMISRQAKRWAAAAGAKLGEGGEGLCEISPLVSYGGEGLGARVGELSGVPFHLDRRNQRQASAVQNGDAPEDFGDLSPFVFVPCNDGHKDDHLERYEGEIDIPRPRTHAEVVRHRAAKSAAGRRRAELESSEEATRPFSRLNRTRTAHLLMAREQRSRREVERAQNASLSERGIDETLTKEMQGLSVLEQARHPCLEAIPLLSRSASSAGSKQGRSRREMARLTDAFGFVEDNDHRAAGVNVQGEGLDDAWVAVLGSTLETNHNVRSVLLNRNSIGDKGIALLARSLRANSSVQTLSLGGNHVTDEGARSFADLLKSGCSSLKALNLAGATPQPASVMQSGPGVKDHLADACIRAPGAAALALALGDPATRRGCFLLCLNLAYQRVWDAGAIALATALRRPECHLQALGLSGTQLTDVAAEAFSRALSEGKKLDGEIGAGEVEWAGEGQQRDEEGQIETGAGGRGCIVGEEEEGGTRRAGGLVAIACSLRRLDLSYNSITDDGARSLAIGLQQSAHRQGDHDGNSGGIASGNGNGSNDSGAKVREPESAQRSPVAPAPPFSTTSLGGSRTTEPLDEEPRARRAGSPTTTSTSCGFPAKTQQGGLIGLDLAFNHIGPGGVAALHDAITTIATGMVFLELRGNKDADNGSGGDGSNTENFSNGAGIIKCSSSSSSSSSRFAPATTAAATGELLKEIEAACEERRRLLRWRRRLDLRRRTSEAVASSRASTLLTSSSPSPSSSTSSHSPKQARNSIFPHGSMPTDGDHVGSDRQRRPGAGTTNGDGIDADGREGLRRLPGCENSAAKPRPLEGALPARGYYVSPLLDSGFDLLMLREPVVDPGDLRLYINRTRDTLEQRRVRREQQQQQRQQQLRSGGAAGGNGQGQGGASGKAAVGDAGGSSAEGRGTLTLRARLKNGDFVSPLAINSEREEILAERRRLFYEDSDFAARKNARIAGRGQNKSSRSKLLTQKHTNTAFTRNMLATAPGLAGVKCPRGLRAHYLGLQNFEYDWGVGSLK
eukprot:g17889.t1